MKLKLIILFIGVCLLALKSNASDPLFRNGITAEVNGFTSRTGLGFLGYNYQLKNRQTVHAGLGVPMFARCLYYNSSWVYTVGYSASYSACLKSKSTKQAIGFRLGFFNSYHSENAVSNYYSFKNYGRNYFDKAKVDVVYYTPYCHLVHQRKIAGRFSIELSLGLMYNIRKLTYSNVVSNSNLSKDPSMPLNDFQQGVTRFPEVFWGARLIYVLGKEG